MKYGLSEKQLDEIIKIISSYQEVEKAVLFGSRAIDTFKEASDVDIAIIGEECDLLLAGKVKYHLEEETYLPFFFDIIAYNSIKSDDLKKHIQTKGEILFERKGEWEEVRLGEIIDLNYGKSLVSSKRIDGDIPVYSSAGITGYHNIPLVNSKGLIVGRKGTIGTVYKSETPFYCIDTAYYILPSDEKYNFNFMYYLLQTLGLKNLNSDSAVPGLNRNTAYDQSFLLPPLPEQKAIAEVLSSLDDKIDLLHRQNKTLEEMAETLFRQWFIEERDESWEEKSLDELIDIGSGKGLKKDKFINNGKYPILGANGKIGRTNDFLFDEKLLYTGRVGTLGNIFRLEKQKVWLSDNTLVIRPKCYFNFIYFTLKDAKLIELNVGSTQPLIRQSDIKSIKVLITEDKIHHSFEKKTDFLFNKINKNIFQINNLENLRDTLLPKLLSGDVRVKS